VEPREYFGIRPHRRLSIWIPVLMMLALAWTVTLMMPKLYTATTRLFVAIPAASVSGLAQSGFQQKQVAAYAELATSPLVLESVIEQLDLPATAAELADSIEATVPVGTLIIEIAATDPDPTQSARIADAVGTELADAAGNLAPSPKDGGKAVQATILSVAEVPTAQSSPNLPRNLGLGLILGISIAVLLRAGGRLAQRASPGSAS
jgi:capsular polysaccharide biosynthesis protein